MTGPSALSARPLGVGAVDLELEADLAPGQPAADPCAVLPVVRRGPDSSSTSNGDRRPARGGAGVGEDVEERLGRGGGGGGGGVGAHGVGRSGRRDPVSFASRGGRGQGAIRRMPGVEIRTGGSGLAARPAPYTGCRVRRALREAPGDARRRPRARHADRGRHQQGDARDPPRAARGRRQLQGRQAVHGDGQGALPGRRRRRRSSTPASRSSRSSTRSSPR